MSINYEVFWDKSIYYRRSVKGIARPLRKLIETNKKFLWTDKCEDDFKKLKESLTSAIVLAYPQSEKQFILATDKSNESVAAVFLGFDFIRWYSN